MHISLRCDEKIYINGAVIRADRKVRIELLNDANFLLEAHVMQAKDATSPLRQLYFIVQMMLMAPNDTAVARGMFNTSIAVMTDAVAKCEILTVLAEVNKLVEGKRYFDALKRIRALLPQDLPPQVSVSNSAAASVTGTSMTASTLPPKPSAMSAAAGRAAA